MTKLFAISSVATLLAIASPVFGASDALADHWVGCSREHEICNVPYPTQVRFGAQGYFLTRGAGGPIPCERRVFGGDPTPGLFKTCGFLARDEQFGEDDYEPRPPRRHWNQDYYRRW